MRKFGFFALVVIGLIILDLSYLFRNVGGKSDPKTSLVKFQAKVQSYKSRIPRAVNVEPITTSTTKRPRRTTVSRAPQGTGKPRITFPPDPTTKPPDPTTTTSTSPRPDTTPPPPPTLPPPTTTTTTPTTTTTTTERPSTTPKPPAYNGSCGCTSERDKRVPFFAAIYLSGGNYRDKTKYKKVCAGVIIDKRHVLASQSCFETFEARYIDKIDVVVSDDYYYGPNYEKAKHINGTRCPNPYYREVAPGPFTFQHLYHYYHDYSIIKLNEDIEFGDDIRPVCFQSYRNVERNPDCLALELQSPRNLGFNDDNVYPLVPLTKFGFLLNANKRCKCDENCSIRQNSEVLCPNPIAGNRNLNIIGWIIGLVKKLFCILLRGERGRHMASQKAILVCPEPDDSCPNKIKWHVSGIFSFLCPHEYMFTDVVGEHSKIQELLNSCG